MQKSTLSNLLSAFESHRHKTNGVEFWYARELQGLLDYTEWRKFEGVIEKAILACKNSKQKPQDHFVGADKMVSIGSGAERLRSDYHLTRYACYLIDQNGDIIRELIERLKLEINKAVTICHRFKKLFISYSDPL